MKKHKWGYYSLVLLLSITSANAATPIWALDKEKSHLSFHFLQAGVDESGDLKKFDATFKFSPDNLAQSQFNVVIDMRQFETGDEDRNAILLENDMFAVERFPQSRFVTQHIKHLKGQAYLAKAELTIRGKTQRILFPFTLVITELGNKKRFRLRSDTRIKRLDYGVGQGDWADTTWIADEVLVKVDVQAVKQ